MSMTRFGGCFSDRTRSKGDQAVICRAGASDTRPRFGGRYTGYLAIPPRTKTRFRRCFYDAFTALHKFDLKYPFGPWILRIAANYCIDQLRRRKSRRVQLWSELTEYDQERLLNNISRDNDSESGGMEGNEGYARISTGPTGWIESKISGGLCFEGSGGKELRRSCTTAGDFGGGGPSAGFEGPGGASKKSFAPIFQA